MFVFVLFSVLMVFLFIYNVISNKVRCPKCGENMSRIDYLDVETGVLSYRCDKCNFYKVE